MIRTVLISMALAGAFLFLTACDSGDTGGDPAKEARRPEPTEKLPAPGPDLQQAEQKAPKQGSGAATGGGN